MNISELASVAAEVLADRESTGKAVTSVPTMVIPVLLPPKVAPNNRVRGEEHPGVHIETVACRWPHNVHAARSEPQVGHPYRVTD